ncbi:hypothetical protein [Pseudoramibacter porci]|uniref:Uncharacterized protein n=1 Tax=Pseudoramibacter porci TaxID=2606631 RepID=A0A7X2NFP9_9FIRM|nr:hypothetical protein [Pseudoramibacter porci]MSS19619.1 hypothetical protein [Pseudoramibacter porci]
MGNTALTFGQYLAYLLKPGKLIMMLVMAAVCIAAAIGIILVAARVMSGKYSQATKQTFLMDETISLIERFYELIFSSTFILMFVAIYFAIDYFGLATTDKTIWSKYNGIILLFFILGSVILNSFVDNKIIPLNHIRPGERASMRLLGMIYMLVIFAYIKFLYVDSNYDNIIMYFITLVIGRFVYFDASLESFQEAMSGVRDNLPILLLALMCTAIMAAFGFKTHYLLEQYGVVFNLFYAHIFLLIVIFIVHQTEIANHFVEKTAKPENEAGLRKENGGIAYPGQETMWLNAKAINERDREIRYQKAKEAEQMRQERRRARLDEAVKRATQNRQVVSEKPVKRTRLSQNRWGSLNEKTVNLREKAPHQGTEAKTTMRKTPERYISHRDHTHSRH